MLKTHIKLTKWKHTSVVQTQNRTTRFGGLDLRTGQQPLDKSFIYKRLIMDILQHASRVHTAGPHELCHFYCSQSDPKPRTSDRSPDVGWAVAKGLQDLSRHLSRSVGQLQNFCTIEQLLTQHFSCPGTHFKKQASQHPSHK